MLTVGIFALPYEREPQRQALVPSDIVQAVDDNKYVSICTGAVGRRFYAGQRSGMAGGGDVLDLVVFAAVKTFIDRIEATSTQWDGATIGW